MKPTRKGQPGCRDTNPPYTLFVVTRCRPLTVRLTSSVLGGHGKCEMHIIIDYETMHVSVILWIAINKHSFATLLARGIRLNKKSVHKATSDVVQAHYIILVDHRPDCQHRRVIQLVVKQVSTVAITVHAWSKCASNDWTTESSV